MSKRIEPIIEKPIEAHSPDLYDFARTATGMATFDDMTDADVEQYHREGFLVVERAFGAREVADAADALIDLLDGKVPGFLEASEWNVVFESRAGDILPTLSREQKQDYVRRMAAFSQWEPRLMAMTHHPKLLATVRRLMGGRQPVMFQEMALLKPPLGREKPWHQDNSFFSYTPETPVVGTWIALDPATPENGCMRIVPGAHRTAMPHFARRDWQICDRDMYPPQQRVAVPLLPGGMLLFSGMLPHGTPSNRTSQRRRAVQVHYAPVDAQKITDEQRLARFGGDAKGGSC